MRKNRDLTACLRRMYEPPAARRERQFFRELEPEKMHTGRLIWQQLCYMPKYCFVFPVFFLAIVFYLRGNYPQELLSFSLAMMPPAALFSVLEGLRSAICGMEELEMSSRFSLKSIVLARMEIMGGISLLIGLTVSALAEAMFFYTAVRLLVPYLLTAYGCLLIARRVRGREQIYLCAVLAGLISMGMIYTSNYMAWIYTERYTIWWVLIPAVVGVKATRECGRVWSPQL